MARVAGICMTNMDFPRKRMMTCSHLFPRRFEQRVVECLMAGRTQDRTILAHEGDIQMATGTGAAPVAWLCDCGRCARVRDGEE
jgi:hypothetical protein